VYLSPEELEEAKNWAPICNSTTHKSDLFRIGLTLLNCANLDRERNYMNQKEHTINFYEI